MPILEDLRHLTLWRLATCLYCFYACLVFSAVTEQSEIILYLLVFDELHIFWARIGFPAGYGYFRSLVALFLVLKSEYVAGLAQDRLRQSRLKAIR